jgi:hypothetical protein
MREARQMAEPSSRDAAHMSLRKTDMVRLPFLRKGCKLLKFDDF